MQQPGPDAESRARKPVARHRAGGTPGTYWDTSGNAWPELAHRVMRLSVVLVVGAVLTGVALTVTQRLHPVASPGAQARPSPTAPYRDPPWTVPLPSRTTSPTPTPSRTASPTPKPKPKLTSNAVPRRVTTTTRTRRATTTAPVIRRSPALLGPPGDGTLEAVLTTYCVESRGALAVAALGEDGIWGCRHAERTTPLDLTAACGWFYGAGARPGTLDKNNPYSWRCFR